jgi:serine/threonine protein kinase
MSEVMTGKEMILTSKNPFDGLIKPVYLRHLQNKNIPVTGSDVGKLAMRFDDEHFLGHGDAFVVARAVTSEGREVAVKFIRYGLPPTVTEETAGRLLAQEAEILESAGNAGIAGVAEFYGLAKLKLTKSTEVPALVREYFPESVTDLLGDKEIGMDEVVDVAEQVAKALDGLRERCGVLITDIGPDNIFRREDGSLVLGDLNMPVIGEYVESEEGRKWVGSADDTIEVGQTEPLVEFTAPEMRQKMGMSKEELVGAVGSRTQVYSLAKVAYRMLGGESPDGYGVITNTEVPIQSVGGISEEVMVVLKRATSEKPEERYSTPGDFAKVLKKASSR